MPNPNPGDGDLQVGTQGQVLPIGIIYLATFVSGSEEPAPEAKLGTSEPASAFKKVGLLRDDIFTIDETDPDVIEYRRGFRQRYFGEVVRQAGQRTVTAQLDEVEPQVIADLLEESVEVVSGGRKLDVGTSEQIDKTMLVVYFDALSDREYHVYSPKVIARFKFAKNDEFMVLELNLKLITFKNAGNKFKDLTYYEWD